MCRKFSFGVPRESLFKPLNNQQEASNAAANIKEQMLAKKQEMYKRFVSMFKVNPSDVFKLLSE